MANDMQPYQPSSMPALPSGLSTDAIQRALSGRVDQSRLKLAVEDLVRPHFYESPEERIRQVAVLVKDLAEFSDDVAGWAVREWRLKHDRKPSSATLRQLCMVRRMELSREMARRSPVEDTAPFQVDVLTEEERAHRRAVVDSAAASCGFVKNRHGQWELPDPDGKSGRIPHWSETAAPDDPRWTALRKARAANALAEEGARD